MKFYYTLSILVIVYVGDSEMAGSKANLPIAWKMVHKAVEMEPLEPFVGLFLGCNREVGSYHLQGCSVVRAISYNVEPYQKNSIDVYWGGYCHPGLL